jgi:hypothetical protein
MQAPLRKEFQSMNDKAIGGSDVCHTCAAHCVALEDAAARIAQLEAALDRRMALGGSCLPHIGIWTIGEETECPPDIAVILDSSLARVRASTVETETKP